MLGHLEDEIVKEGCDRLKEICSYFEWLGSYPRVGE
jgi:chorismate mutase/prephenate dehydratase